VLLAFVALHASAEQRWHLVANSHFEILSDGKEKRTLQTAREFERFRVGCQALLAPPTGEVQRTRIIMFSLPRDRARYYIARQAAAFVIPWRDGSIVAMAATYADLREEYVARHELVHTFSLRVPGKRPPWFEEGLAEVLGVSAIDVSGNRFQFGLPNDRMRARSYRDFPRLKEQLLEPGGGPVVVTGDPYWYYWLLAHYLTLGPEQRNADLRDYLDRFEAGEPHAQAFEAAFGMSPRQLWDAEIIPYMAAVPSATVRLDPTLIDDQFTVQPAPQPLVDETLMALLDYKQRSASGQ
jgi:hypothetical protein